LKEYLERFNDVEIHVTLGDFLSEDEALFDEATLHYNEALKYVLFCTNAYTDKDQSLMRRSREGEIKYRKDAKCP
jgi:hypothetical protein